MEVDRQGITGRANSGTPLIIIESNLLGTFYKSEISVFRTELDYQSLTTSCPWYHRSLLTEMYYQLK